MKWFLGLILFTNIVWAENSKVIPAFLSAAEIYVNSDEQAELYFVQPEIRAIVEILKNKNIKRDALLPYLELKNVKSEWPLKSDEFDQWISEAEKVEVEDDVPEVSVHGYKMKVTEESDDYFNDDIYVFYFITDGVIPTGKVSSIYKGINQGQSFNFNEVDRVIFPLSGIPAKKPHNHLIVDYGILESDGDDITELQKLSSIIIDIAISVYNNYDPENAEIIVKLRQEVKSLAQMLIGLNNDDRLATGSFGLKNSQIKQMLEKESYVEFSKHHHSKASFDSWDYEIYFRLLRN